MTKKRMFFCGGGYADIPLILAAKKLGYYVITSGNRNTDLGHQYSDETKLADYSDNKAIYKTARQMDVDVICPSCNDFAALASAYTAEMLSLPGHDPYDTARIIHHKDLYREFALKNNIPAPKALGFQKESDALNSLEQLRFPLIVKPVDLTGGKGISVLKDSDRAGKAISAAFTRSKAKRIVIEEYISGSRHGFSAFLHRGKIVFTFLDDEYYYLNQYLVSASSTPADLPDEAEKKLIAEAEKIASILKLKDGIFHVQFILKDKKDPVIIEICRRPPGDLYVKLVEYATGADYPEMIVKAFSGTGCDSIENKEVKGFFTRHCIRSDRNGKFENIIYDSSITGNIVDQFLWRKKGDIVSDYMTENFGIVFLKFDNKEEMRNKTREMQELIKVIVN